MVEILGFEFPYADDKYHDPAYEFEVIGKRVPCYDGYDKVNGKAKYTGDVRLPNMLHAKILRSTVAHANIKSIDTSKAEALLGVKAVVTYKDRADQATMQGSYTDHFLVDKVRQWGDPIAAVAAETEEIAEDALGLIEVDYEELPVILEFEDAVKPGAPLINEKLFPGNIAATTTLEKGDIEQGFMEADTIIERDYTTAQTSILNPTLNCCVASYENGILTVWNRNQEIAGPAKQISPVVNVPLSNIRVISPHGEGAYSSSVAIGWHSPVAALLAVKTGRPVRLETEIENVTITGGRYPMQLHLKVGVKEDGTITALDAIGNFNAGAYGWISSARGFSPGTTLNYYNVANGRYVLTGAATNRGGITQWRGYGAIMAWPMDALMDEVAEIMGFDTLEFRKKNFVPQWDLVSSFGRWLPLTSTGKAQIVDKLSQAIDWASKWSPPNAKTGAKRIGIGIGTGEKG